MKIVIESKDKPLVKKAKVGDVYSVRGGIGGMLGHMQIILGMTKQQNALVMTVDSHGELMGCDVYSENYMSNKSPIGFCEGLDELQLTIKPMLVTQLMR